MSIAWAIVLVNRPRRMCNTRQVTSARHPARRSDDDRRTELIQAAARVIARDGIAAATTRRIAQEAGVPPGLVHYWFAGKDELLEAVISDTLASIETAAAAPADAASNLRQAIFSTLRAAVQYVQDDDRGRQIAMYEMTTWALRKPELAAIARRQYAAYRQVATDSVAAWSKATGIELAADPAVAGQFISVLIDGLCLAWLADPDTNVDGVLAFTSTLLAQLTSAPAPQ